MKFKAGSFRLLHSGVYKVLSTFSPEQHREHRVFIYLEAGPNSHYSGLFHAFPADISKNTLVPIREVPDVLRNLQRIGLIVFDEDRQLVHVRGMLKRQLGTQTLNDDNAAGIVHYTERMPEESPAVLSFMEENREIPEFDAILEDLSPPVHPRVYPPGTPQEATPTSRLLDSETLDEKTLDSETKKRDTGIAEKSPATPPCGKPFSSTPESKPKGDPQVKGSPIGSSSTSTPESKPKAKASGKGKRGNGKSLSSARMKKKGLAIAAKRYKAREWDIFKVSDVLTNEYQFTKEEINSREVFEALGLSTGEATQ